jgi:predicted Ser/Thr protein kinase
LPENAPEGLCPACLAKVALGSEPAAPGATVNINPLAEAAPGARVASDPSQLAAQFPQLEILALLGMGGMGMVYKARQPRLDRLVALKILPVESGRGPSFAERFEREAKALAKLNHPGIVTLYDFGQTAEYYYFIMEYMDGMNLRRLLQTQPLEPRQALELVAQICTALQFAHDEKIVHRDIKPENILLNKKGQVKIADFGLAKLLGNAPDTALTMSQAAMGTINYMAPEQRQNAQGVDHRADIYSLGVVFYEMLTGEVPMGRFDPPSKRVQVDVRLDEVVLRALEREPARRYQQVSEIKSSVETITATAPAAPPVAPAAPGPATSNVDPQRFPIAIKVLFAMTPIPLLIAIATGVQGDRSGMLIILVSWGIILALVAHLHSRQRIQQARARGLWPPLGEFPTLEHVRRLAVAGERVLAIKLYRQIRGVALDDAMAAVEKLAGDVKSSAETSAPKTLHPQPPPGFASSVRKTTALLVLACLLGACAGLAPGISFTGSYWGLRLLYFQTPDSPITVNGVVSGSPAEQTGFLLFDELKSVDGATNFHVNSHQAEILPGKTQTYEVQRGANVVKLHAVAATPQLAAFWYEDITCPIAGALLLCLGVMVFATGTRVPPPLWRSISVAIAGLVIAVGLGWAIGAATFADRVAIYQRWDWLDTGKDYYFQQGLIGVTAAILVAIFGAVQIRQRLAKAPMPGGSLK